MVASTGSEKETGATVPSAEKEKKEAEARDRDRNRFLAGVSCVVVLIITLSSGYYGDEFFGTGDDAADFDTAEEANAEQNAVPFEANSDSASAQDTVVDSDSADEATEQNAAQPEADADSATGSEQASAPQDGVQEDRERAGPNWEWQHLIPYTTCLAGVLLFIMGTARAKRDDWDLDRYWGEHAYRVAQAFAYLFVVWWAWSKVAGDSDGGLSGTYIRPNILGFLVGFFILRVERAMDGLGDKFEQILFAVLPRAAKYTLYEERRRQQVQAGYRLSDIVTQWDAIAAQIGNEEVKAEFEQKLEAALEATTGSDPEKARRRAARVSRMFEQLKSEAGWDIVAVDDLSLTAQSSGNGRSRSLNRGVEGGTPESDEEETSQQGDGQDEPPGQAE